MRQPPSLNETLEKHVKRLWTIATVTVLLPFLTSVANADDKAKDTLSEKLQGRWEIVGGAADGRKLTKPELEGTYVVVEANNIITYDADDQATYEAVYWTDPAKKPKEITMTAIMREQPNHEERAIPKELPKVDALGILKFDGNDTWYLCYALPGKERPKEFKSSEEEKNMLFKLKRAND